MWYILGECVGRGGFGTVYKALDLKSGEVVAVKKSSCSRRCLPREVNVLRSLAHPNVVQFKAYYKKQHTAHVVMEFCAGGSLKTFCQDQGGLSEDSLLYFAFQVFFLVSYFCIVLIFFSYYYFFFSKKKILEGLRYLHSRGVVHGDLKAANILTNEEGCVKLSDFGSSFRFAEKNELSLRTASPYWTSPEEIERNLVVLKSDIWSFGSTMLELLTTQPPYFNSEPFVAMLLIAQQQHPPLPQTISHQLKDLLLACFQKDLETRPSAKCLLGEPIWANAKKTQILCKPNFFRKHITRSDIVVEVKNVNLLSSQTQCEMEVWDDDFN
eukprot:Lithocolla_globosa_v1_NODE_2644_length_1921_cov_11.739014.p1 type:complete len:325 gc:universal NODE_2644_length_1921_cov_11.739014:613-1587(+)